MAKFSVDEIAKATGGRIMAGRSRKTRGVCIDSRKVTRGCLFIAIKGERFDGHDFVLKAFKKGAGVAIVSESKLAGSQAPGKTLIVVEDTVQALQDVAAYHRRRFKKLVVVGITGSNGKTTVKDMTACVLSKKYKTLKTKGNLNNHIGAPLTLLRLNSSHEAAVIEMGMSGPGEIAALTKMTAPSIGVITNISSAHIGSFRSIARLRKAKAELIENMPKNGKVALNADDMNSRPLIEKATRKTITFGRSLGADVLLVDTWPNSGAGRWAAIYYKNREQVTHIPLLGQHHTENALAAFAVGALAGVDPEDIAAGIDKVKPAAMRMELSKLPNGAVLINDAYNANPASTRAALESVSEYKRTGRLIFVFGDMLELGSAGPAAHKKTAMQAAKAGVDRLYTIGKLASIMGKEAALRGVEYKATKSHERIAKELSRILKPGDTVLIKGSRGMAMEKVAQSLNELMEG